MDGWSFAGLGIDTFLTIVLVTRSGLNKIPGSSTVCPAKAKDVFHHVEIGAMCLL